MADTKKSVVRKAPAGTADEDAIVTIDDGSEDVSDVASDAADSISDMMSATADGIEEGIDTMAVIGEGDSSEASESSSAHEALNDDKAPDGCEIHSDMESDEAENPREADGDGADDAIPDVDSFADSVRERLRRIDEIGNAAIKSARDTRLPSDDSDDAAEDSYRSLAEDDDLSIVEEILERGETDGNGAQGPKHMLDSEKPADASGHVDAPVPPESGGTAGASVIGDVPTATAIGTAGRSAALAASSDSVAPIDGIVGQVSPVTVDGDFDATGAPGISSPAGTIGDDNQTGYRASDGSTATMPAGIGENGVNTTKRLAFWGNAAETIPHGAREGIDPDGTEIMPMDGMGAEPTERISETTEAADAPHITHERTRRADEMPNEDSKRDANPFADGASSGTVQGKGEANPGKTERMPKAATGNDPFADPARIITPAQGMRAASVDASQVRGRGNARRRAGHKHGKYFAAKVAAAVAVPVLAVGIGYGVGVNHYTTHLLPNTELDGVQIGGMTVDEAKAATSMDGWTLTLVDGKGGDKTAVTPDQIGLKTDGATVDDLLAKQDAWMWPLDMSRANASGERHVEFDEEKLRQVISDLPAVKGEGREKATDAKIRYDGSSQRYVVDAEKTGNVVDAGKLYDKVSKAIGSVKPVTVDYEDESLYVQPSVTKDDQALNDSASSANKMLQASVTYNIDGVKDALTVNSDQIKDWVTIGDDGKAVLDEAKVKEYLGKVGKEWDTVGTTRSITTPDGRQKTVSGGDYGWVTDEGTELTKLVSDIKAGNTITRDFATKKKAAGAKGTNEWGDTYVEVDLSTQQMWYVKGGQVILNFPIISGKNGSETPTGVFSITRKQTNQVLLGEIDPSTGKREYETPVDKWMPTSYGSGNSVGLHSSSGWRSTSLFYTNGEGSAFTSAASRNALRAWNGSHGCMNMTDADANSLYAVLGVGDPVIIHN